MAAMEILAIRTDARLHPAPTRTVRLTQLAFVRRQAETTNRSPQTAEPFSEGEMAAALVIGSAEFHRR